MDSYKVSIDTNSVSEIPGGLTEVIKYFVFYLVSLRLCIYALPSKTLTLLLSSKGNFLLNDSILSFLHQNKSVIHFTVYYVWIIPFLYLNYWFFNRFIFKKSDLDFLILLKSNDSLLKLMLGVFVGVIFGSLLGYIDATFTTQPTLSKNSNYLFHHSNIVYYYLLWPITEEIVFRSYLFRILKRFYKLASKTVGRFNTSVISLIGFFSK